MLADLDFLKINLYEYFLCQPFLNCFRFFEGPYRPTLYVLIIISFPNIYFQTLNIKRSV